jgi:hypothetical protein
MTSEPDGNTDMPTSPRSLPVSTPHSRPGAIVLLLVGIPTLSVILSTTGLVLAAGGAGDLVRDDYYKAGMVVQQDLTAARQAEVLGIGASLVVRGADIELHSDQVLPSSLHLTLVHPAWARHDVEVTLTRDPSGVAGGAARWTGKAAAALPAARWAVLLTAEGARWQLRTEASLPGSVALGTQRPAAAQPDAAVPPGTGA